MTRSHEILSPRLDAFPLARLPLWGRAMVKLQDFLAPRERIRGAILPTPSPASGAFKQRGALNTLLTSLMALCSGVCAAGCAMPVIST